MLGVLVLAARLLVAAVFAVAALAKLADRAGTRRAAVAFGGPQRLAPMVATAVPVAELAIAGLLLPKTTVGAGAAAAAALLVLFSAAIWRVLRRGRSVDCRCFGPIAPQRAGREALARNGLLVAVAIFAAVAGFEDSGPSAFPWPATTGSLVVLAVFAASFVRRRRSADSVAADPAPAFTLRDLDGEDVSLEELLLPGRPVALVFADPSSPSWPELTSEVAWWQRYESHALTVALVVPVAMEAHGLERILLDPDRTVHTKYGADRDASAVLVSSYGFVTGPVAVGRTAIAELVRRALEEEEPQPALWEDGLAIGDRAPDVALRALDGRTVGLSETLRGETVLLFWLPGCRPCRNLYEQVRAWEKEPPRDRPRLVVISAGDADQAAAEGFSSDVFLDDELVARAALGAGAAPTAVRLDAQGRVASRVAVGAGAVMSLLHR